MVDLGSLAVSAVGVVSAYLSKVAGKAVDGVGDAVGRKLTDWMKDKLGSAFARAAMEQVEANPEKSSGRKKLEAALEEALEQDDKLASELRALLAEARKAGYTEQTMNLTGDDSVGTQVSGDSNQVTIHRKE